MTDAATPRVINTRAAAEILGLEERTLQRRAEAGLLPVLEKLPGRTGNYLFEREAIEAIAQAGAEDRKAS